MIEPKQIIRSNRKSLSLIINERGELIVHAPKNMPLYEIVEFMQKKEKWIEKKCNELNAVLSKNNNITTYNEIFYLGKRYKVVETQGLDYAVITDKSLIIPKFKNNKRRIFGLKQWYMTNIETILITRIQKLANFMKLKYKSVNIINSKAKWGMCDSQNNLYFNWKILMLSGELIDYVIIHELSHLIELNHSQKFWEIVKAVIPNYKQLKDVLKRCSFLIKLF